jgi:hypothetical protein
MLPYPGARGAAALARMLVAFGFNRAGWLGDRERIEHVVWSSDGRWLLTDACGRQVEATLRDDTRVGNRSVWLRWNANRTRSKLLISGDLQAAELRRLIVRLRIQGGRRDPIDEAPGANV